MEIIHYRIPDAVKWLQMGMQGDRPKAQNSELVETIRGTQIKKGLREFGGRLLHIGRSAYSNFIHKNIENVEYVLLPNQLEVHSFGRRRSLKYEEVVRIFESTKDHYTIISTEGKFIIKPVAYLNAGRIKVPIGWNRQGADVPYDLLIKEVAAHCKPEIEYL